MAFTFSKKGGPLAGIVLALYPIGALCFLLATYIDTSVMSGEGFGFAIGNTKIESYDYAHQLYREGKISALDTWTSNEGIEDTRCSPIFDFNAISNIHSKFDNRDYWVLHKIPDESISLIGLYFSGNSLKAIRLIDSEGKTSFLKTWSYQNITISFGDLRQAVYKSLLALSNEPGFESLEIVTGWKAQEKTPQFHPEEFYLIREHDEWLFYLDRTRLNTIKLTFKDNTLQEIQRKRRFFRFPWECWF